MKYFLSLLALILSFTSVAQYEDIAPGWTKEKDRILINGKMDELIDRVSFERDCPKEEVSYIVSELYNFYVSKKDDDNFPKKLVVKSCGQVLTYINECPPNNYGKPKQWIEGKWVLIKEEERESRD